MKRNVFVIALMLTLLTLTSFAQRPVLGVHLGANMDKTIGQYLDGEFKGTFVAGGFVGIRIKNVGITAEANFSQPKITTGDGFWGGFKNYVREGVDSVKNHSFKMNELSIPILISYNLFSSVWVQAGPQYTAIVKMSDQDNVLKDTPEAVFTTGYISGIAGLWIDLPLHLKLSGRYVFGITDRNNSSVSGAWHSRRIQLTLGFGL